MRTRTPIILALMLAAAVAQPAAALPINIDTFEVGDFNVIDDSTTAGSTFGQQTGLATTDVAGGVRLVRVIGSVSGLGVATAAAVLVTSPLDDQVAMTVVAVPDGTGQYEFIYDGIADGVANGISGALNLNLSAISSLDVTLSAANVTGNVQVTVSSSTQVRDQNLAIVNGVVSFPMSGFTLNLADIQEIKVLLTGLNTAEAPLITSIVAVPEPAAGLLVAVGLVGLAIRRRAR